MKNLVFLFNLFLLHLYMLDKIYNYGHFSKLSSNIVTWSTCLISFYGGLFPQTPVGGGGGIYNGDEELSFVFYGRDQSQ